MGRGQGFRIAKVRLGVEDQDVPQDQLQGMERVGAQVDQRIKIGVPLPDGVHQRDHRDHGLGQRDGDEQQEAQVAGAVDPRRLVQLLGDRIAEIGHGQNDLPDADRIGHDHRPRRVQHAHGPNDHIGRDQPSREQHGENDQLGDQPSAEKIHPRQGEGHGDGQHHAQGRAGRRIEQRVDEAADDLGIAQGDLIAAQGEVHRPEADPAGRDGCGTAERTRDDIDQRQQHNGEEG
ncbi:hypothetical protein [Devosia sp. SD17-2]|uniref:hypothetical protein n=1 Tax=Devosia sp. SD17-2 TaxID=2976459 RepID=UPI0023D81352|nr:hypothetical protein [Devosia sp. SD17-2]WEJ32360.1 hypothetical protein NYQ88_15895 [Devosia sp. SD17-2]